MEENKITTITQEKTELLKDTYRDTLEILDAYDRQTLTRPKGTYYDGNETMRCLLMEKKESVIHYWLLLSL